MPKITPISWKKFEKFLIVSGCVFERQKGDHRVYSKAGLKRPIILPEYKALPVFIILNNLRTLGISTKEYIKIMQEI